MSRSVCSAQLRDWCAAIQSKLLAIDADIVAIATVYFVQGMLGMSDLALNYHLKVRPPSLDSTVNTQQGAALHILLLAHTDGLWTEL